MITHQAQKMVKPGTIYNLLPDGRWEFFLDNHLISTFVVCEQKFKHKHLSHLAQTGPLPFGMSVGIWWHELLAWTFSFMKTNGSMPDQERYLMKAADFWHKCDMNSFEKTRPKQFHTFKGQSGAVLMAQHYFKEHLHYDLINWTIIATESAFGYEREVFVGETDRVVLYNTGIMDLLVLNDGRIMPVDHKTIERIDINTTKSFKPHGQTAGYIYSAEAIIKKLGYNDMKVDRCIINIAARSLPAEKPRNGKPKPRFIKVFPQYTADEINEWKQDRLDKAERLRYSIEKDIWTKNDSACHLYSGCEYRDIDSVTPGSRQTIIDSQYMVVQPWNPYGED